MRIGALAARAGVGTKTIRYYESIGLLPSPPRAPNGYRVYTDQDLRQLRFVRSAQAAGLSLRAIRDILAVHHAGMRPCHQLQALAEDQIAAIDRRIAELQTARRSLAELATRASLAARQHSCSADEICSAVTLPAD